MPSLQFILLFHGLASTPKFKPFASPPMESRIDDLKKKKKKKKPFYCLQTTIPTLFYLGFHVGLDQIMKLIFGSSLNKASRNTSLGFRILHLSCFVLCLAKGLDLANYSKYYNVFTRHVILLWLHPAGDKTILSSLE